MLPRKILLALAGISTSAARAVEKRDGGFLSQCAAGWSIGNPFPSISAHDIYVQGSCFDSNTESARCSYAGLNPCYNNVDGVLQAADGNGDFYETCFDCTADHLKNVGMMSCTCLNKMQQNVTAQVNLNDHIHVIHNVLGCNGAEGRLCGQ